jgi:hypothetical protein
MVSWKSLTAPAPSLDVPGLETVDLADKAMEKRIVRKQDLRILPWICVTYLLSKSILPNQFISLGIIR